MNKNESLGLPPGSVRAAIAMSLVFGLLYLAIGLQNAAAITAVSTLAGVAITSYFGKKSGIGGGEIKVKDA